MKKWIPLNKPYQSGNELKYIQEAIASGTISGNGIFTKKCQRYFEKRYGFKKCLLTTSCTDALEMAAILLDIRQGDEVIVPSYTFVSSANAFVLRGARIVFADSRSDHPNLDVEHIKKLITSKTKAIVVVHYAGVACAMDEIMALAEEHGIYVVEDAAQAIDSYYKGKPLGGIGHLAAFSFHETKNIISGEGGMLVINDEQFKERSEIIWEKGTNRSAFYRGEVDKYGWVDIGSSFLPSDMIAAYLYAQLEQLDDIQKRRLAIWNMYNDRLKDLFSDQKFRLPKIHKEATNNAHMYYLLCDSIGQRERLIKYLKDKNIHAVFHYLSLHESSYYTKNYSDDELVNSAYFTNCLLRLPLYYEITEQEVNEVCDAIAGFSFS